MWGVSRDAPDSQVHLDVRWNNQRGWHELQPQSSQAAHTPRDKSGLVSMDEKAPEDAQAARLFQALPAEPMLCTYNSLSHPGLGSKAASASTAAGSGITILPA